VGGGKVKDWGDNRPRVRVILDERWLREGICEGGGGEWGGGAGLETRAVE